MFNGRLFRMSLELTIASIVCLVAAVLTPLSAWQSLGEADSSLAILAVAASITGAIVLRNRPVAAEALARYASVESA